MATISVLDANGDPQDVELPNADGRQAAAASRPVALATEDLAAINAITTALADNATGADIASVVTALGTPPTGAATSAKQDTLIGHVDGIETLLAGTLNVAGTFWQATQPVSIASPVAVTGTFWQATQPVSGTVSVSSVSGSVAVTGTFWQATQPVSAASLPLPTGAATEATLAAQSAKLPASLGTKGQGASLSVASAGLEYETVAASQTAQTIGATGATGDYLSHVVVQPTSTAPGVVTILDNAVEVHAWPGGTVGADLAPFVIPIGAFSVSGAWKITTGANVKCTAYGDFT